MEHSTSEWPLYRQKQLLVELYVFISVHEVNLQMQFLLINFHGLFLRYYARITHNEMVCTFHNRFPANHFSASDYTECNHQMICAVPVCVRHPEHWGAETRGEPGLQGHLHSTRPAIFLWHWPCLWGMWRSKRCSARSSGIIWTWDPFISLFCFISWLIHS